MKIPIDYKTMLINNVLAVQITSELSLKAHIDQIAKSASRKHSVLFRYRRYFFNRSATEAIYRPHSFTYVILLSY